VKLNGRTSSQARRGAAAESSDRPQPIEGARRGSCRDDAAGGAPGAVLDGGRQHRGHLRLLLQDRLQQRHGHPRLVVGGGTRGHVGDSATEDKSVQQLVRDQCPGLVVILGPPRCRDLVAQGGIEADALQRYVAQHGDHVDDERLALGPVQRVAPAAVDQGEQVAPEIDVVGRATVARGGLQDPRPHLLEGGQRLGGSGQVAVGLLAA